MAPPPLITPRVNLFPRVLSYQTLEERELTPSDDGLPETTESPPADERESEMSELSELESDIESDQHLPIAQKIPQPSGQPGRPGSGGYSIEDALSSWGKDELGKVTKFTKKLADTKLDQSLSYSKQDKAQVNRLCETVARNYPIVGKYEDYWPVRGILKLHLKVTSESFRRGVNQLGKGRTTAGA